MEQMDRPCIAITVGRDCRDLPRLEYWDATILRKEELLLRRDP